MSVWHKNITYDNVMYPHASLCWDVFPSENLCKIITGCCSMQSYTFQTDIWTFSWRLIKSHKLTPKTMMTQVTAVYIYTCWSSHGWEELPDSEDPQIEVDYILIRFWSISDRHLYEGLCDLGCICTEFSVTFKYLTGYNINQNLTVRSQRCCESSVTCLLTVFYGTI